MSYVRVWVHAVWGTKNREPFLPVEIRTKVLGHIRANARNKQIYIDRVNGYSDHLHCLFCLNADVSIARTLQLIKGECSRWINKEMLTRLKFEWADEYYAVSVSESALDNVRAYIDGQEEHHRKKTFSEEVEELMREFRFVRHG